MKEDMNELEGVEPRQLSTRQKIATTIIKESAILFFGLFIGWFWRAYAEDAGELANLVVFLFVIIIVLVRFIVLLFMVHEESSPEE